jgi:hypothetical protein
LLAASFLAPTSLRAADYERPITFREPLGFTWTDEIVHRDEKIAEARVAADTFALEDAEGRAVPLQVEVLDGKSDAVKTIRLWLKTTLPQTREVAYRLTYNDEGRKVAPAEGGAGVRHEEGRLILSSGSVEVAVPSPATAFAKPVEFSAAPAPILGVRFVGGKTWFGRWTLEGPSRVREIKTTVTAAGPVWAEIRMKYIMEARDLSYEVTLRAVRGEPCIDVLEKPHLPATCHMTATLRTSRRPFEALWMPWFIWRDNRLLSAYDLQRLPVDDPPRAGEILATLRPRWTQAQDNSQVLLAVLADGDTLDAAGQGGQKPAPGAPVTVGAIMIAAGDWTKPYEEFPTARTLESHDGLALDFPLVEGQRHWALMAGPPAQFDSKAKLQRLIRRNADIPLDRVLNDWVLQWPRDAENPGPHILTTWPRLQQIRDDLAAGRDTATTRRIKGVLDGKLPGDRAAAEYLAGRREELGSPAVGARLYLERSYQDDFFNPTIYPLRLATALRLADLAYPGRPAGDASTALAGYIFSDPNYWPGYTGGWDAGSTSLHGDMVTVLLDAAATIPDHPAAKKWMATAVAALRDAVRRKIVFPGGAGVESPGQTAAWMATMLPAMETVQNAGGEDPFHWPEMHSALEFLRNLHTPPDPRLGRRDLAPIGEAAAWQDSVGQVFGMAAQGLRQIDPKLAALYMGLYRQYGGEKGTGDLLRDVLQVDPSIAAGKLEDGTWTSHAYPGFGAVLRSEFGTAHEAFATFKCGPSRGRYQGDELSFHFFGAAMPVALDWHGPDRPRPEQEHMHNRVSLGDNENMDAVGELLATAFTPAADVAVGQLKTNHLRKMPRYPQEILPQAAYPERQLDKEARYRRYLMLVKHAAGADGARGPLEDYLVIRDELSAGEPATFNLFVLARSVRQDGQTFRFDGQLAADAIAFFATPEAEKVTLDRWGWPRPDDAFLVPRTFRLGTDLWRAGEVQQWVRVTAAPGQPFLVVLYPYRKGGAEPALESLAGGRGVRISAGGETEEVYLSTDPAPGAGGQAVVRRGGQSMVILKAGAVAP